MDNKNPSYALRIGTMLQDRYRIDEVLDANGMTITYLCFDIFREQKVVIKELFPNSIVERNQNDQLSVSIVHLINENDFLTMREHMIRKAKTLISMYPMEGIANIMNLFEENQTVYVIAEYAEGVSPLEFMQKIHSHPMQLKEIVNLLKPVMKALDKLHKKGIVHGRISPSMIRTKDKKVVLVGFGDPIEDAILPILEEATARVPEYAAVEQYMENATLDAATDVYAIGMIIYEAITRVKVAPFYERVDNGEEDFKDPLVPIKDLNVGLMTHQSEAIMKTLELYQFNRYYSFEELQKDLADADDIQIEKAVIMHRKPAYFSEKYKYIKIVRTIAIVGAIFLLLFFGPKAFRYTHSTGAKDFYLKLENASVYEQCRMIVQLSEDKRESYANDYNKMEEPDVSGNSEPTYQIHYYDKVTKRFVTNDKMDLNAKIVRYIRLDYRRNNTAILMFYDANEKKQVTVNLQPDIFNVYTVTETVIDREGKTTTNTYDVKW